jgi:hypothetical protein
VPAAAVPGVDSDIIESAVPAMSNRLRWFMVSPWDVFYSVNVMQCQFDHR